MKVVENGKEVERPEWFASFDLAQPIVPPNDFDEAAAAGINKEEAKEEKPAEVEQPQEAQAEEKPAEEEAPAVEEEAPAEEPKLIAGKFKSVDDLVKAYESAEAEMHRSQNRVHEERQTAAELERRMRELEARITEGQRVREDNRIRETFDKEISEDPVRAVKSIADHVAEQKVQPLISPIAQEVHNVREELQRIKFEERLNKHRQDTPDWDDIKTDVGSAAKAFWASTYSALVENGVPPQAAAAAVRKLDLNPEFLEPFTLIAYGERYKSSRAKASEVAAKKDKAAAVKKAKAVVEGPSPTAPIAGDTDVDVNTMSLAEHREYLRKKGAFDKFSL